MKPVSKIIYPFALPQRAINLAAICVVTTALAACGGGSGGGTEDGGSDTDNTDTQGLSSTDTDNDGLFDQEELEIGTDPNNPDSDGNGIQDGADDLDGDGVSNLDELIAGTDPAVSNAANQNADTVDSDGDDLFDVEELEIGTDPNNPDTDGDGTIDSAEDPDGDGVNNIDELIAGTDPLVSDAVTGGTTPPVMQACADPDSSNADWTDNCQIQRFGDFADSLYTVGIQRVLSCQGFNNGLSFDAFTDGEFGPGTERAVRDFQTANSLVADGIVGPDTWGALFNAVSVIVGPDVIIDGTTYIPHSIDGCGATRAQFYQEVEFDLLGGWRMAEEPGSLSLIDFSTGSPF